MTYPENPPRRVYNPALNALGFSCVNIDLSFVGFWFWTHPFVFHAAIELCNLFLIIMHLSWLEASDTNIMAKMTPILLFEMISKRFQQSSCNNYYHLFHYQNALLRSQCQKIDFTHGGLGYSSQYVVVFIVIFFFWLCLQFL